MISKNYFKYLLRSLYPLMIVSGVIGAMALGFFPAISFRDTGFYYDLNDTFSYVGSISGNLALLIGVAIAVPLVLHSRYYSKNSSDIYLSLPINRKQAFITENLFGLMIVLGSTIVGFLFGLAFTGFENFQYYLLEEYYQIFQALPLMLFAVVISYMMSTVAVNVSNSMIEAIFVIIAIHGISLLIWGFTGTFFHPFMSADTLRKLSSFSYGPGVTFGALEGFIRYSYNETYPSCKFTYYAENILTLSINFLVWAGLCFLAYIRFTKLKSEHLGTAFMEKLGGPDAHAAFFGMVFIEVGALLFESLDDGFLLEISITVALLGGMIAYWVSLFVLRRRIGFRKDDLIRFAIAAGAGVAIGFTLYAAVTNPAMEAVRNGTLLA